MKYFIVMMSLVVFFGGCLKSEKVCTPKSPASEEDQIKQFAAANNINAVKHPSGLYYEIIDPGYGLTPRQTSSLEVKYVGKFMNGTVFDQSATPIPLTLGGVIEGWQIGLPLIKKGGKIKLIIPSAYGYGCNDYNTIPGNSVLYFDVDLVEVK